MDFKRSSCGPCSYRDLRGVVRRRSLTQQHRPGTLYKLNCNKRMTSSPQYRTVDCNSALFICSLKIRTCSGVLRRKHVIGDTVTCPMTCCLTEVNARFYLIAADCDLILRPICRLLIAPGSAPFSGACAQGRRRSRLIRNINKEANNDDFCRSGKNGA